MNAKEINQAALYFLLNQDWQQAQYMLFKNAKENPSHESYNNLGNYLIHEGLFCKNGTVRNARKLGKQYLMKAAKIRDSSTTMCALAKTYDYELQTAKEVSKDFLYQEMKKMLISAYTISPEYETEYNLLRLQLLTKECNELTVKRIRALLKDFICAETARLYFEVLRFCSLYDEGKSCIEQYGEFLPEDDILLFYAKHKKYCEGYRMCDVVYSQYSPTKYISAAIIECCINTNHPNEADYYARSITEIESNSSNTRRRNWLKTVFSDLRTTNSYRKKLISEYLSLPPFLDTCCYYDCVIHQNSAMGQW